MSLLGSLGGMSFDQERDRLQRIREPLTAIFRRSIAQIEADVDQSTRWLRELLGASMPALRQMFEAQLGFARESAALTGQLLANAAAASPDLLAAAAKAELASQLDQLRTQQLRKLADLGVDPTSLRATALDRGLEVAGAGELARTGTAARMAGAERQAQLAGLAQAVRGGDMSAAGAGLGMLQGLAGMRAGVLGQPLQQGLGLGQLVTAEAGLRQAANASQMGALDFLGSAAGMLGGLGLGAYILSQPSPLDKLLAGMAR